ncbi:hypothetical protein [Micromonospora carbonacea]|uniref:Molecular chaperone DnaJ n=1 Tax=Micromonospora carbonacea TaxID=47853 RepID=A0A1C5A3A2_9ACTN|nr:hypothetical protein [Micromonospora carbonacea]SCF39703.1 hypothetical protein GA0070563_11154 [Micromonospora carbonacea]
MSLIRRAVAAITACSTCKGTGEVPHYHQSADVIDRAGRKVAGTECTRYQRCPACGGLSQTR